MGLCLQLTEQLRENTSTHTFTQQNQISLFWTTVAGGQLDRDQGWSFRQTQCVPQPRPFTLGWLTLRAQNLVSNRNKALKMMSPIQSPPKTEARLSSSKVELLQFYCNMLMEMPFSRYKLWSNGILNSHHGETSYFIKPKRKLQADR